MPVAGYWIGWQINTTGGETVIEVGIAEDFE
jgi:hypothetical protein